MAFIPPEQEYIIVLIYSALHDVPPAFPPEGMEWEKLYCLSALHGVSNLVFYGLKQLPQDAQVPGQVMEKFCKDWKKALAREAAQHLAMEEMRRCFEENAVANLPLKGCLLKYLYPRPDMRFMADIDILVRKEQTGQVKELMQALGFIAVDQGGNHDIYHRKPFLNVEIHRRLISDTSPYYTYLEKVWDRAVLQPGYRYTYRLSREDLYIYIFLHLTKHYMGGGTGIRSFLDLWVYLRRYEKEMDMAYIGAELELVGLRKFEQNIRGFSKACFENGQSSWQSDELHRKMAAYVFSSGAYGTQKFSTLSSLRSEVNCTRVPPKLTYLMRLFFPPMKHLINTYPFLSGRPWLLPACWILRGGKCLLFKQRYMVHIIGRVRLVSRKNIENLEYLHKKTGMP